MTVDLETKCVIITIKKLNRNKLSEVLAFIELIEEKKERHVEKEIVDQLQKLRLEIEEVKKKMTQIEPKVKEIELPLATIREVKEIREREEENRKRLERKLEIVEEEIKQIQKGMKEKIMQEVESIKVSHFSEQ